VEKVLDALEGKSAAFLGRPKNLTTSSNFSGHHLRLSNSAAVAGVFVLPRPRKTCVSATIGGGIVRLCLLKSLMYLP
jgi:hypothetical protein